MKDKPLSMRPNFFVRGLTFVLEASVDGLISTSDREKNLQMTTFLQKSFHDNNIPF